MLDPHYYVAAAWQNYPEKWPEGGITHVPLAQAERAVELALHDAEKYRTLLMRAIRNSTAPTTNEPHNQAEADRG